MAGIELAESVLPSAPIPTLQVDDAYDGLEELDGHLLDHYGDDILFSAGSVDNTMGSA